MQEYRIKRTEDGYKLGLEDIVGKANSFKKFVEKNKYDLRYAVLAGCNLKGYNLSNAYLKGADLSYSDLQGCNLKGAVLIECNLSYCNLSNADLRYIYLTECNLSNCNLSYADLMYCKLSNNNMIRNKIYFYNFFKTSKDFNNCFISIGCKTKRIKAWKYFFSDKCKKGYSTKRKSLKFQEIKKEYFEAIEEFKIRFDKGEIK